MQVCLLLLLLFAVFYSYGIAGEGIFVRSVRQIIPFRGVRYLRHLKKGNRNQSASRFYLEIGVWD